MLLGEKLLNYRQVKVVPIQSLFDFYFGHFFLFKTHLKPSIELFIANYYRTYELKLKYNVVNNQSALVIGFTNTPS